MLPEWRKEMQSRRKLEGIDVSHWEGRIDFSEVRRAGIRIVYIKASEGDRGVDPDFERNYREAQTAGLKIGFYHYLTARTVEEGREQARHFAGVIREKRYEACPVMDFESFGDLDREQINAVSLAFLRELEMLTKKMVAVYSDASNAANVFDERLAFYPLWIAEYGVKRPEMNNDWREWAGWQYTDAGRVRGIKGTVDRDYFTEKILADRSTVLRPRECPEEDN